MMLRNRSINVTNENDSLANHSSVKGAEKRASKGLGDVSGPEPKRVALTDISSSLSSVLIDSSKKTYDQKSRIRLPNKSAPIKEEGENLFYEKKPYVEDVKPVKTEEDPCPDYDFDKECMKDITSVAEYARDIFLYYKYRQNQFVIGDYLKKQRYISAEMRALVVNWLIGVQEQFELNHETLYLAVKIMDLYLFKTKSDVKRIDLQLIGGTAIFLASKFDERVAPLIDDLLYMCDDNYTSDQMLKMELILYNTVGFDLGVPLSYRFLRRFARVIKLDMPTLTLARYILETSLMFYDYICVKDDLMAAASLLLALRMKKIGDWDARLVKYSGYRLDEVEPLMWSFNHMIIKRTSDYNQLETIYNKYSHEIFFEVAKIPSLPNQFPLSDPIKPPANIHFH